MPKDLSRSESSGFSPGSTVAADEPRVLLIADDYQFLDTIHGHVEALRYEYIVAVTRERVIRSGD